MEEGEEGGKGRSVVKIETSADVDQGVGVGFGQLSTKPTLRRWIDEALRDIHSFFVLGYEKLHSSLLQGACLGLKVDF